MVVTVEDVEEEQAAVEVAALEDEVAGAEVVGVAVAVAAVASRVRLIKNHSSKKVIGVSFSIVLFILTYWYLKLSFIAM